jgi:sugar lactone lactonase YvrE
MIEHDGHFYAIEPNHGQVIRVNPGGHAEELIDISATQGHAVPTGIALHDGVFYVGTLSTFPIQRGAATVLKISERGELLEVMGGFTTVTGITFDNKGRMYVSELSDAPGFPTPGAGKIVRVDESGSIEDFVTGLVVPTAVLYGPDGALYVSDFGAAPPGLGRILRVTIPD